MLIHIYFNLKRCCFTFVALLALFSCNEKNTVIPQQLVNNTIIPKMSLDDSIIPISFDSIVILNFDDYFSKIEIIPLETVKDMRFTCHESKFVAWLHRPYCSLEIDEKEGNYIIFQYLFGPTFYFDKNGQLINIDKTFTVKEELDSIPNSLILDYKDRIVMSRDELRGKGYYESIRILTDNKYVFPVRTYKSNQLLFVVTECMERIYFSFYNKQTSSMVTGLNLFSNGLRFSDIRVVNNGILYCLVDAWNLNSAIDFRFLTEDSRNRLHDIQSAGNSVIVKYYAK